MDTRDKHGTELQKDDVVTFLYGGDIHTGTIKAIHKHPVGDTALATIHIGTDVTLPTASLQHTHRPAPKREPAEEKKPTTTTRPKPTTKNPRPQDSRLKTKTKDSQ